MDRKFPTTESEISGIVHQGYDLGQHLQIIGGGLSLSTANLVPEADFALDLTGLFGVEDYVPSDLTLRVAAGTRFSALQAELAEHGQEIPLDVPFPEQATIGGLVATGFAGPRRYSSGTLKDLLIGCAFVRGDGLLAKAGGMVVKNVSGFELPRLMHGSWGTLAVITSVNLKVLPKPRAEATLIWTVQGNDVADLANKVQQCLHRVPGLAAATVERRGSEVQAAVRVMGRNAAVKATLLDVAQLVDAADLDERQGSASADFWQEQTNRWATGSEGGIQLVLGAPASDLASTLQLDSALTDADLLIQPGSGGVRLQVRDNLDQVKTWWHRHANSQSSSTALIESAPPDWREGIDVWGPENDARTLMRSVKQEFDPGHVLNRGRLFV